MKSKIQVNRLALEGDGVGHPMGEGPDSKKVAFVAYSLPGETIEARLLFDKKNHSRWLPVSLVKSAPNRIPPPCPYHFIPGKERACGGCDWQHLAPADQKKSKAELLKETLIRLGGIPQPPVNPIIVGPHDFRYRNKIQIPFGLKSGKLVAGFFAPGTHDIVEFEDCLIQPELSVKLFQAVKRYALQANWAPYDEDRHRGWIRHVLIRTNEAGQAFVAIVATSENFPDRNRFIENMRAEFPQIIGLHLNIQRGKTHAILGPFWKKLWGADRIEEQMAGLKLSYSPGSFFQVNTQAAERLYGEALRQLEPTKENVVLDIYCGVGALTFLAAQKAKFAVGIEEAPSSIRDAGFNAQQNKIPNIKFIQGSAERSMFQPEKLVGDTAHGNKLLVMVDPPRSGCKPEVLSALLRMKPRRIVYVSCNPATLARDIKILSPHYQLTQATPVDLFPQTSHIEAVAQLDRF